MALEASDRLIDIIWVSWRCTCGCISRPTFKLSASLHDIIGKSKEISQDLRGKKWQTSTSLVHPWEQFPNAWRYHVHLYKQYASINTMGTHSRQTAQEGDAFCLLEMNVLWCKKYKSIPEQQDLVKMLEETGTKVSISTVKRVLYQHNLKGRSARKKPLPQNRH